MLALIGSVSLAAEGGWPALIPLIPLVVAIWAWRVGTDVNTYGVRVRALLRNRVVSWEEIAALVPDERGVLAVLTKGSTLRLTAVKAADLPRILQASGKTPADAH